MISVTSLDVGLLKSVIKPEEQSHFSLGKTQASTSFLALKTWILQLFIVENSIGTIKIYHYFADFRRLKL